MWQLLISLIQIYDMGRKYQLLCDMLVPNRENDSSGIYQPFVIINITISVGFLYVCIENVAIRVIFQWQIDLNNFRKA